MFLSLCFSVHEGAIMAFSKWICKTNAKKMFVKIVHIGGHIELHDRPLLAAEIMLRNPKCCVAHPHVFRQPLAIVAPDTTLMLGQKFYVVPIRTVRKLQRSSPKHSSIRQLQMSPQSISEDQEASENHDREKKIKFVGSSGKKSFGNCLVCLTRSLSSSGSSETKMFTEDRNKDQATNGLSGSPRRSVFLYHNWQPSLESISEE